MGNEITDFEKEMDRKDKQCKKHLVALGSASRDQVSQLEIRKLETSIKDLKPRIKREGIAFEKENKLLIDKHEQGETNMRKSEEEKEELIFEIQENLAKLKQEKMERERIRNEKKVTRCQANQG